MGIFLEINSSPRRNYLNDIHCKNAKVVGIKLAISTDSHVTDRLKHTKYGGNQARRGWLEARDVINTRNAEEVLELMIR